MEKSLTGSGNEYENHNMQRDHLINQAPKARRSPKDIVLARPARVPHPQSPYMHWYKSINSLDSSGARTAYMQSAAAQVVFKVVTLVVALVTFTPLVSAQSY